QFFRFVRASKDELGACGHDYPVLNSLELEVEDCAKVVLAKRAEHNDLVDSVHELRREFSPGGVDGGAINVLVDGSVVLVGYALSWVKSDAAGYELGHFSRAEIGRHDDYALGEIDSPIVSQREGRFV